MSTGEKQAVDFATNADLLHMRDLRRVCGSLPRRARCKRCRLLIPTGKRRDAIYCSKACKRSYRWEQRNKLVDEIRAALRAAKVAAACACGTPLRTETRPGPVPKQCVRCYTREAMRRYRERKRAAAKECAA